jgi:hypothetical protein
MGFIGARDDIVSRIVLDDGMEVAESELVETVVTKRICQSCSDQRPTLIMQCDSHSSEVDPVAKVVGVAVFGVIWLDVSANRIGVAAAFA